MSGASDRHPAPSASVGGVVLTMGTRPDELRRAVDSFLAQEGVDLDLVVVGNGWDPATLDWPGGVRTVRLSENRGIPAGRNAGARAVTGEWIAFLDDDAAWGGATTVADAVAVMRHDASVGLVQPRVVDPTGAAAPARWTPRRGSGDPARPGPVFSCWEGAVVLPRDVFDAVGGWASPFFYAHEGIELAWRVWDAGRRAWYAGDLVAHHPVTDPRRHAFSLRLNARNRVWLARRNLPAALAPAYVGVWTAVQLVRSRRHPASLLPWFAGFAEGWRSDPGGRRRMRWRTVWRMTRAGRPPVV